MQQVHSTDIDTQMLTPKYLTSAVKSTGLQGHRCTQLLPLPSTPTQSNHCVEVVISTQATCTRSSQGRGVLVVNWLHVVQSAVCAPRKKEFLRHLQGITCVILLMYCG